MLETIRGARRKRRERHAVGMTYLRPDTECVTAPEPSNPTERPSGDVHIDEWVAPDICDDHGALRPGKVLEWMDAVGALAATRFARAPVTTVSVDGLSFQRRIAAGNRISMRARVVHTSARSIGVAVTMTSGGSAALAGFMTFVVVGTDGHAAPVPRFHPETPEEVAGHREGETRTRFRRDLARDHAPATPAVDTEANQAMGGDSGVVLFLRELGVRLVRRTRGDADSRPASISYVHKIEPVRGGKLNFHGTLYGGTLMRWLETCAAMSASSFLSCAPRLLGVDGLAFLRPVASNTFVHLDAIVVHRDEISVTVMVRAVSEEPLSGARTHSLRGFFTYAPLVPSMTIPKLERGTCDDALFCEVVLRHRLREALTRARA